ncbi:DUF2971 domain-containing protein [Polyangium aurulentum]|uniref:DUF2971 domain-containing protein n=1 Tax=Polyangium aurulentum TaxID=2567896 RepID=UPI0010AE3B38|nr:DUF2971 domain-containing protein [Polyangium aurulentum]UQA59988.1 DUF2971 domain-containing protein [Polyangium aurulentum]
MDALYRLRSMDALLSKFHELEQQEIYLSSPSRLNDPMEGYKDVFWDGDSTLWENLLGHYILSLVWATVYCLVADGNTFEPPPIAAMLSDDRLPTDAARDIYRNARRSFFSDATVADLPKALASIGIPLRAYSLRMVLNAVHLRALNLVAAELKQRNMMPAGYLKGLPDGTPITELLNTLSSELQDATERSAFVETLAFQAAHISDTRVLHFFDDAADAASLARLNKKFFLVWDFPRHYVAGISEQLIHPSWFTACFTATCQNASMWSVYADEHRGAALVFKPTPDSRGRPSLTLSMVTGMSSSPKVPEGLPIRGKVQATLYPVIYSNRAPQVDFFKYLGQLPMPQMERQWYTDQSGTISPMLQRIYADEDIWREQFWQLLYDAASTKLEDWKHEQEYRLIVPDPLGLKKGNQKATFDFSELGGIVFGMNAKTHDKLAVMRIVKDKCEKLGRKDLQFWQMRYLPSKGQLVVV